MQTNLRWKIITILGVVALAGWSVYPPEEKVRLGLDLKGGVHMVLRVQTDDALRLETESSQERLRSILSAQNIAVGEIASDTASRFHVEGVSTEQDAEFRRVADEQLQALFTRESGAGGEGRVGRRDRLHGDSMARCCKTLLLRNIVPSHGYNVE